MKVNKFTRKIICAALNVLLVSGQTAFAADLPLVFTPPLNPPVIVTPVISPLVRPSGAVLSFHAVHYETEQSVSDKFQNFDREELATGNLSGITAPGGVTNTYDYVYDSADRLLNYGSNAYTYTASGELLTKTSEGRTTTCDYDVAGNLMSVQRMDYED